MTTTALERALDQLPKVELHCHIEGTMRPATVVDLARRTASPLPVDDPDELYRYGILDRVPGRVLAGAVAAGRPVRLGPAGLRERRRRRRPRAGAPPRRSSPRPATWPPAPSLADIVAGLDEGLAAAEARDRHPLPARSSTSTGPTDPGPAPSCRAVGRRCAAAARRAPSGSSGSGWTPPRSASTRARSPRPTHRGRRRTAPHRPPGGGHRSRGHRPVRRRAGGRAHRPRACRSWGTPTLVARFAGEGIPLTVCPTSNIVIANKVRAPGRPPVRGHARGRPAGHPQHRRPGPDRPRPGPRVRGGGPGLRLGLRRDGGRRPRRGGRHLARRRRQALAARRHRCPGRRPPARAGRRLNRAGLGLVEPASPGQTTLT